MQFKGRIEKLKIKQHGEQRTAQLELSCQVSKEQEQEIIEAFMKSAKGGVISMEDTIFGKDIEFDLGAVELKK